MFITFTNSVCIEPDCLRTPRYSLTVDTEPLLCSKHYKKNKLICMYNVNTGKKLVVYCKEGHCKLNATKNQKYTYIKL